MIGHDALDRGERMGIHALQFLVGQRLQFLTFRLGLAHRPEAQDVLGDRAGLKFVGFLDNCSGFRLGPVPAAGSAAQEHRRGPLGKRREAVRQDMSAQ
ncbi:hypothetical protein D9M68_860030 [compost metagenome]